MKETKIEVNEQQNQETNNQEVKQPTKSEVLRELSKEWGINAFNPSEVKEKFNQLNQWQESQKTELEKLKETADNYNTDRSTWNNEKIMYESQIAGLTLGIKEDSLNDAVILAKNYIDDKTDIKTALGKVLDKYPSFKIATNDEKITIGVHEQQNNNHISGKTDYEKYIAENYEGKKKYNRYLKK